MSNRQSAIYNPQLLVKAFAERARAVAAQVTQVSSVDEAARVITEAELPTSSGLYTASSSLLATYPELRSALEANGVQLRVAENAAAGATASEAARLLT